MNVIRSIVLFLAFVFVIYLIFATPMLEEVGKVDLVTYWSGARLLIEGRDPYNLDELKSVKLAALGVTTPGEGSVSGSWNPPWLLLVLLPLGLLPFEIAARLWLLVNISLILLAVLISWVLIDSPNKRRQIPLPAIILPVLWGGSLSTLKMGQISGLLLVVLLLLVWAIQRHKDWLAGPLILICLSKPHIMYLPLLLFSIQLLREHRWRVLISFALAVTVSFVGLSLLHPTWYRSYTKLVVGLPFAHYSTSTLVSWLRFTWGINIPSYIGILILLPTLPLLSRLSSCEDSVTAINTSLLLSLPLAPYGFSFDHILLVPALVQLALWLYNSSFSPTTRRLVIGLLAASYIGWLWLAMQRAVSYHLLAWPPIILGVCYGITWIVRSRDRNTGAHRKVTDILL